MPLFRATEPNYVLVASSLSFGAPALVCYCYGQYAMSPLCAMLMMSSVQFHGNPALLSFLVDQTMIGAVVVGILVLLYQLGPWALLFKAYCIFIYYSPYREQLTYHPNRTIADLWHGSMHVLLALAICAAQPFLGTGASTTGAAVETIP
jgi:hypothetical protein